MIDYLLSTNWKWLFIVGGTLLLMNCIYYFFKFVVFLIKLSDLKAQLGELNSNLNNLRLEAVELKRKVFNIEQDFKALHESLPHDVRSIYYSNNRSPLPPHLAPTVKL